MNFLHAPWRWNFLTRIKKEKNCVFCDAPKKSDKEALICFRGKDFFIILNKYPYNSGHLMIVPYLHIDSLSKLNTGSGEELISLMNSSLDVLKNKFNPQGFNIGMNIGEAAGAGIKEHIHMHIVPRWKGDSNFMAVTGGTEVLSYDIYEIQRILSEGFNG